MSQRFHQLWTVLFAPEPNGQVPTPALESIPGRVAAAVSLFPPLQSSAEDDCQAMTVDDLRKTLNLPEETAGGTR